jgi:hypothetical protein
MVHEQGAGKLFAQKKPENIPGNGSPDLCSFTKKIDLAFHMI